MAKLARSVFVGGFPWEEPQDQVTATVSAEVCRGFLTLPYNESSVYCDECKDPLPLVARWTDSNRQSWNKYELPQGDFDQSSSRVYYSLESAADQIESEIPLGSGISRSLLDELLDSSEEIPESLKSFSRMRDQIDTHIEFVNDLYDQIRSKRFFWEGNCGGLAIRSVYRVTSRWVKSGDRDNARLALIVKLAREISRVLGHVCDNPRVVLRRSREFQKISKIQEIDPSCLRWLARQPGRDVYERAGSRQELLGVIRKEDTDTLENRMVKDLLHRVRVECANYISIHRDFLNHDRVRTVASFRRQVIHWERNSDVNRAKRLVGSVQPNYVLLHEPKYRKLWDAYQLLLSQQKQKDDIWKWRGRTFSESCEFGILYLFRKFARRSTFAKSDVIIQMEAVSGKFVSPQTQLGSARTKALRSNVNLSYCTGVQANRCPYIRRELYPLAADFFLVAQTGSSFERLVPVWCLIQTKKGMLDESLKLLERKLSRIPNSESIRPLILAYDSPGVEREFFFGQGRVVKVEFPMMESIQKLESIICRSLGIA